MKGFTSLLACGLFAATFLLSGCIGYYERVIDSPVLIPIPRTPPVEGAKKRVASKVAEPRCKVISGHKYCIEVEESSPLKGDEVQAYCATPAKVRWLGEGYVCEAPKPEGRFVPTTSSVVMVPMSPYGYPMYGPGLPFMPFMGPFWGGALYGGPPVFYTNPQQPQSQQSQQSQLQQVLKQNQEILRRLDQK